MIKLSNKRQTELKNNFRGKRIAVVGDLMVDCYIWGAVKRISPEAPVPVVEVEDESQRFGGAANVALNIATLGGVPVPFGVIGKDAYGEIFERLLSEAGITGAGLIRTDARSTTAKTRVIAHNQHVVRIDKENTAYIDAETEKLLIKRFEENLDAIDAVILQDYNKGVLTPAIIENVISLANSRNILVTVDPKFNNFFSYKNVTVMKPNRKEAGDVLSMKIKTEEDKIAAGSAILEKLNAKYVLLTLSEEGIMIFQKGEAPRRMPTKARRVADVSGAGDTVISTLTLALAAGSDIVEASYLANFAGGIVCEEVGIVPIDSDKLFEAVAEEHS